jgi:hypothetical protein
MNLMLINVLEGEFFDCCFIFLIESKNYSMVDQVPSGSPYETFSDVAKELFCDGIYNWGRIVTLFYFTYKLIMKVC